MDKTHLQNIQRICFLMFYIWSGSTSCILFSHLLPHLYSPDHCSVPGGKRLFLRCPQKWHQKQTLYWLCDVQEEEAVQEEEQLQGEDQQLIETWTRNVKACTCDCEAVSSPTRTPASVPPVPPTTWLPPQGQPPSCMPGKKTADVCRSRQGSSCWSLFYRLPISPDLK